MILHRHATSEVRHGTGRASKMQIFKKEFSKIGTFNGKNNSWQFIIVIIIISILL
jgi:hypothetical protein